MAEWKVVGQMGKITKKSQYYMVNIAENRYKMGENGTVKESTIWFNCISSFKPKVETGDTVIAEGTFEPSKNPSFPYAMIINHIGVIKKKEE